MHLARKLFYRLTRELADHEIVLDMAEFFLVDKRVRDAVLSTRSTFPFVRGQVGLRRLPARGHPLQAGAAARRPDALQPPERRSLRRSRASSRRRRSRCACSLYVGLVAFALDGVVALWLVAGGAGAGLSLDARLLGALVVLQAGWLMLALGGVGIYLARVYKDSRRLPLYVVDEHASSYRRPFDGA